MLHKSQLAETIAIKRGVDLEPISAELCTDVTGFLVFLCGFCAKSSGSTLKHFTRQEVHRELPAWWGREFVFCPSKDKFKYWPYLIKYADDGSDKLKLIHTHHFQIKKMMLAVIKKQTNKQTNNSNTLARNLLLSVPVALWVSEFLFESFG